MMLFLVLLVTKIIKIMKKYIAQVTNEKLLEVVEGVSELLENEDIDLKLYIN